MGEAVTCSPSDLVMAHLQWLQEFDRSATDSLATLGEEQESKNWFRVALKTMEWSMHGLVWFILIGYCFYTTTNIDSIATFTNILLALILDLIIIGFVKVTFRRARPPRNRNDMVAEAPYVDQFSFPSGHSSRGAMMTRILFFLVTMETGTACCVLMYPVALALSRVMLGRHYLSDVGAGLLIGTLEGEFIVRFWLTPAVCAALAKYFREIPEVSVSQ